MAAVITQVGKSAMQSGRARAADWRLEYDASETRGHDPLTGWVSSDDTRGQIRLSFPTLEAAQAYAARHGLSPEIRPAHNRALKLQAYADNFR